MLTELDAPIIDSVAAAALEYLQRRQQPDGSIAENPAVRIFAEWDTVNTLAAATLWRDRTRVDTAFLDGLTQFLQSCEKPETGMLSWGPLPIGAGQYCTETSSCYIAALARLGDHDRAWAKARFLQRHQMAHGPWRESHPHIPEGFQTEPSVTGFAVMALHALGLEPWYPDALLDDLLSRQKRDGHFGLNWYYYGSYYYLMAPAVACLSHYGAVSAVAAARDFVLSQQCPEGSWYSPVPGFGTYSSPEQHTAMALETLLHAGMHPNKPPITRGLAWLLTRPDSSGGFDGGPYPYPQTPETASYADFSATQHVVTTSRILTVLHHLITAQEAR